MRAEGKHIRRWILFHGPGVISAVLILSACAVHFHARLSGEAELIRRTIFSLATTYEKWSYHSAVRTGPYSLRVYLDHFWARRDPTYHTEHNEYRARFEARLTENKAFFTPAGTNIPDDRIIIYTLFGEPSGKKLIHEGRQSTRVDWLYQAPTIEDSNDLSGDLFKDRSFRVAFRVRNGAYRLCPFRIKPWSRRHRTHLSLSEIQQLTVLITKRRMPHDQKLAAIWRLQADPRWIPFRDLLGCAASVDTTVFGTIEKAFAPLVLHVDRDGIVSADLPEAVGEREAAEERTTRRERGETVRLDEIPTGLISGLTESVARSDSSARDVAQSILLTRVYDPGWLFDDVTVADLERSAAEEDSFLRSHGWLEPEEAAALFVGPLAQARDLLDSEEPMRAHEYLTSALRNELHDNPEALHLDALALLESASPGGRQLSETRIREAMKLDPGNLRYLLTLAQVLYRQTFTYYAEDVLDHALDRAPTLAAAYALKAIIRLEYYWKIGWRATPWSTPLEDSPPYMGGHETMLHQSAYRSAATDLLNRALILDPDDLFASWWLGRHYLLARQWSAAIPVMNYLIENGAHEAEAYLGRGLCFQHLGLIDQAIVDYEAGLALLPESVRRLADDPRWVQLPSEGGIGLTGSITSSATASSGPPGSAGAVPDSIRDAPREIFWRSRDPLFSTPINERVLEQHRRFAYVTWFFAVPNLGLRGWESHRGRIYLRYGEPQEYQAIERQLGWQQMTAEELLAIEDEDIQWEETANLTRALGLVKGWTYPGIRFGFDIGWITGNFSVRYPGRTEQQLERVPESVRIEGVRTVTNMDFTWFVFQDDQQRPEWIPVARIPPLSRGISASVFRFTTFCPISYLVLDDSWNVLSVRQVDFPIAEYLVEDGGEWVGPPLRLPSDIPMDEARHIAAELVPGAGMSAFASRDSLPGFPGEGLRLSSLVLARTIIEGPALRSLPGGTWIVRHDRAIMPFLGEAYPLDRVLHVYFETYGLSRDEFGATSWQVALSITSLEDEKPTLDPLVEAIGRLLSRRSREGTVTLVFDREGISPRATEVLRVIPPVDSPSGVFRIDVAVEDMISGQRTSRSVRIILGRTGAFQVPHDE